MSSLLSGWRRLDDSRDRAELYRLWHAGMSAGFTVPRSLELMGPRGAPHVEAMREWLLQRARRGAAITDLVRADAGQRFTPMEAALLTLGDEAGTLDRSLALLAEHEARRHRTMLALRKQLAYPLMTAVVSTFIIPFPLLHAGSARAYALAVAAGLVLWTVAGGTLVAAAARRFGRKGAFVRARFARALATAVEAGLPLTRSIRLAADASDDPALRSRIAATPETTLGRRGIAHALAGTPEVTPELLGAIRVAEESGDFSVLSRLADQYEDGFR